MIQYILFFGLVLSIFNNDKLIEGIERTCCGDLSSHLIDFNCSGNTVPEGIKRCFEETKDNYSCDNCDNICNNEGTCVPTLEGGYCDINPTTKKIYDGNEFTELGSNKPGEKINDSVRARRKYKNLYSQKCNPFASRINDEDLEKEHDKEDGDYNVDDDFSEIDDIESLSEDEDIPVVHIIIFTVIPLLIILLFIFHKKVYSKLKKIFK